MFKPVLITPEFFFELFRDPQNQKNRLQQSRIRHTMILEVAENYKKKVGFFQNFAETIFVCAAVV